MGTLVVLIRTMGLVLLFWTYPYIAGGTFLALMFCNPKWGFPVPARMLLELAVLLPACYGFYTFPHTPENLKVFITVLAGVTTGGISLIDIVNVINKTR